jgi:ribosome modulation factor
VLVIGRGYGHGLTGQSHEELAPFRVPRGHSHGLNGLRFVYMGVMLLRRGLQLHICSMRQRKQRLQLLS